MTLRSTTTSLLRQQAAAASSVATPHGARTFSLSAPRSSITVTPRNILHPEGEHKPLHLGNYQLNRYEEHYQRTLAPSLLYMTYDPEWVRHREKYELRLESPNQGRPQWDPTSPYTKNRPQKPPRGGRPIPPGYKALDLEDPTKDLVAVERIVITSFCKEAIASKHALLPIVAQMRAITGCSPRGSHADPIMGRDTKTPVEGSSVNQGYVRIIRARTAAAAFKLRPGMPVGVQAVLPRPLAMNFLEVFITFVLPRLRTFQGFLLPPASAPTNSPSALSGVVSLGMGPEAMANFPQTEINWDTYPSKPHGFQVDVITNQRGPHATKRARQMLSGLGVPFVRRGDAR